MRNNPRFLRPAEKLDYYANIGRCDLRKYHYSFSVKIYEGAEILLYHYSIDRDVVFDTILLCVDFSISEKGIVATMVDKKTYRVIRVGEVLNRMKDIDIVTHTPHECTVERTVKITGNNRKIQGVSSQMCFRTRSSPKDKTPWHVQAIPLSHASTYFDPEVIKQEISRLEAEA